LTLFDLLKLSTLVPEKKTTPFTFSM